MNRLFRQAPPHPRGSTPDAPPSLNLDGGSPAPAGIDPMRVIPAPSISGLPRTRGDRPALDLDDHRQPEAPPHPRGSTPIEVRRGAGARGSPAPAGIDPPSGQPADRLARLPRTRGDRPPEDQQSAEVATAPPHPRGSTLFDIDDRRGIVGSPAPAGIDPTLQRSCRPMLRLPRTRGDRPSSSTLSRTNCQAPPHPRGSTLRVKCSKQQRSGSPAPAGIDPVLQDENADRQRLPRTRGDRPARGDQGQQ